MKLQIKFSGCLVLVALSIITWILAIVGLPGCYIVDGAPIHVIAVSILPAATYFLVLFWRYMVSVFMVEVAVLMPFLPSLVLCCGQCSRCYI